MSEKPESILGEVEDLRLPPDVHPAAVEHYATGERDSELDALADALSHAQASARTILDTHDAVMGDINRTPENRAKVSRESALKVAAGVAKKLDAARAKAMRMVAELEARTSAPPPPKDQTELAIMQVILQRLGSMNDDERKAALSNMDIPTVRAVLASPHWVSGVLPSAVPLIQAEFRRRYHEKEYLRAENLKKAVAAMERSASHFLTFVDKLTDRHAVQMAEDAEKRAAVALAAAGALS